MRLEGLSADTLGPLVRVKVDPAIYSEEAIFKTAYWFTGRFFIFLEKSGYQITVEIRPKQQASLENVAEEFCNALIDARVRQMVLAETSVVRDELVKKAFQEGMPKPGFTNVRSDEKTFDAQ